MDAARCDSGAAPPPAPESAQGPISVELWERLRRLDRAGGRDGDAAGGCEIVLCRTSPKNDTWPGYSRVWVATIRRYMPPYRFEMVQHIRPTLAEALTLAVEESEARGWAR